MARKGDGKKRSDKRQADLRLSKRVTAAELCRFEGRASAEGFDSAQAYLTALILGQHDSSRISRKDTIRMLGHLGKIGSNLNQVTRAINSGRVAVLGPAEQRVIEEVRDAVDAIGHAIRGSLG